MEAHFASSDILAAARLNLHKVSLKIPGEFESCASVFSPNSEVRSALSGHPVEENQCKASKQTDKIKLVSRSELESKGNDVAAVKSNLSSPLLLSKVLQVTDGSVQPEPAPSPLNMKEKKRKKAEMSALEISPFTDFGCESKSPDILEESAIRAVDAAKFQLDFAVDNVLPRSEMCKDTIIIKDGYQENSQDEGVDVSTALYETGSFSSTNEATETNLNSDSPDHNACYTKEENTRTNSTGQHIQFDVLPLKESFCDHDAELLTDSINGGLFRRPSDEDIEKEIVCDIDMCEKIEDSSQTAISEKRSRKKCSNDKSEKIKNKKSEKQCRENDINSVEIDRKDKGKTFQQTYKSPIKEEMHIPACKQENSLEKIPSCTGDKRRNSKSIQTDSEPDHDIGLNESEKATLILHGIGDKAAEQLRAEWRGPVKEDICPSPLTKITAADLHLNEEKTKYFDIDGEGVVRDIGEDLSDIEDSFDTFPDERPVTRNHVSSFETNKIHKHTKQSNEADDHAQCLVGNIETKASEEKKGELVGKTKAQVEGDLRELPSKVDKKVTEMFTETSPISTVHRTKNPEEKFETNLISEESIRNIVQDKEMTRPKKACCIIQ